jgi:hypothetical protein
MPPLFAALRAAATMLGPRLPTGPDRFGNDVAGVQRSAVHLDALGCGREGLGGMTHSEGGTQGLSPYAR